MKKNEFDIFDGIELEEEDSKLVTRINSISDIIFCIIKKRVELNMSQRDLALRTGIKQPMIARIESLKTIPRLDTIINIVTELGMILKPVDKYEEMTPINVDIKIEITIKEQDGLFMYDNKFEQVHLGGAYGI